MQPIGQEFTVTIDGEPRTYYVKPDVFSEATMSRLVLYVKAKRSEARKEVLREIAESAKDLPQETLKAMTSQVVQDALNGVVVDYQTALNALQSADGEGLAIALEMNVDNINSRQEARKVMAAYPNMADLMTKVVTAGMSAIEAAQEYDPKTGLGN